MEKKISSAFTYMFKDKDWKFKLLILILFSLPLSFFMMLQENPEAVKNMAKSSDPTSIGLLIILSIFMFFASIMLQGYYCNLIHNIVKSPDFLSDEILPPLDSGFLTYLKYGFFLIVAGLIAGLVFLIPFFLVIPLLVFLFIQPALLSIFCNDYSLTAFFKWKKAFAIVKEDFGNYVLILVMLTIMAVASNVAQVVLPAINKQFAVVAFPFVFVYFQLVTSFLYGIFKHPKTEFVEVSADEVV